MEPKYRSEPFDSTVKSTEFTALHDLVDWLRRVRHPSTTEPAEVSALCTLRERRRNQSWPVIDFAVSRNRLLQETWIPAVIVVASLMLVFGGLEEQTRAKLLFVMTACLFFLPQAVKAVLQALLPTRRGSVRLESDCLVFDPGIARALRSICYEQIWDVDVSEKTKAVYIEYYPVGFSGQIDESRLAALSLNYIQDAEGLARELGMRIYAVPPGRSVKMKYLLKRLGRMFAWVLLFVVAWFETTAVFSILAALHSL